MSRAFRFVLFVGLCALPVFTQAQTLELNKPLERELASGQTHTYTLNLNAKQIARVIAEQKGVDVIVAVSAPDGKKLFEVDSPNGSAGEEAATIAATQSGVYRIEIRSLEKNSPAGRYTIRLDKFLTESEYVTERLAAVGRLWGAVKFFHPYLAYKDIDWDGALVKAIPQVKAARTPDEYRQAINSLLQVLDDPATVATAPASASGNAAAAASGPKTPTYFRTVDGFIIVQAVDWAKAMLGNDSAAMAKQAPMMAEVIKANGIVLDCRYQGVAVSEVPPFYLSSYLDNSLPFFVQGRVSLGTERYRMHNGYAPQQGNTSGGYSSALMTEAPSAINGQAASQKPLAVIIDERTPNLLPTLSGLQAAGAKIVQVGQSRSEAGARVQQIVLPDGVRARIRTTEFVHPNGSSIFQADAKVPGEASDENVIAATITALTQPRSEKATATTALAPTLRSAKDNPYPQMSFPTEEYRLLGLFRYWNVIHYFFPYKHLTDKPWSTVLTDFIPRFLENKTQLEYEMTVAEMTARLQDTHGFVRGLRTLDGHLGGFAPPVVLRVASGKLTIENVLNESAVQAAGLKVGDVILAVDGEPVEQRVAYLAKFKSYSAPQSAYRYVHPTALRGAKDSVAKLRIVGADGQTREVELARSVPLNQVTFPQPRKTPIYQVLPNGYGYIDLARLPLAEAQKAMDAVMNTPGLIFDMRGYPNGTAWAIGPRLSEKKNFTVAQFRRPFQTATSFSSEDLGGGPPDYSFEQKMPFPSGAAYKGKVAMLINEDAISQAEHTCLFFEAAANATFIGSPTNGANGDVTNLLLPGGIMISFSGHDVRHADGRQLQRVGIQPHIKAEPTAQGLREGRDEVLEAAVKFLQTTAKK